MISEKELKLGPQKYFILQYLRSNPKEYYSIQQLVQDLQLSDKTIKTHLTHLKDMEIIDSEYFQTRFLRKINIREDWQ